MPLPIKDILKDINEFCKKTREKYGIHGGYSPKEDPDENYLIVALSFIHEDFYKEQLK